MISSQLLSDDIIENCSVIETILPDKNCQLLTAAQITKCNFSVPSQRVTSFNSHTEFSSVNYLGPFPCLPGPWTSDCNESFCTIGSDEKNNESKRCPGDKITIQSNDSKESCIDIRGLPKADTIPIVVGEKVPSKKQKRADLIAVLLSEEDMEIKRNKKDRITDAKGGGDDNKTFKSEHKESVRQYRSGNGVDRHSSMYDADEKEFGRSDSKRQTKGIADCREDDRRRSHK